MEGRKRYNPNQHVIPTKVGIPDKTRQNKKLDARFREFDNDKMFVIVYTRHNSRFFHPSLKRVAGFIETGDDQKSGNPAYYSVPPLQGGIVFLYPVVTDISPPRGVWRPCLRYFQ